MKKEVFLLVHPSENLQEKVLRLVVTEQIKYIEDLDTPDCFLSRDAAESNLQGKIQDTKFCLESNTSHGYDFLANRQSEELERLEQSKIVKVTFHIEIEE